MGREKSTIDGGSIAFYKDKNRDEVVEYAVRQYYRSKKTRDEVRRLNGVVKDNTILLAVLYAEIDRLKGGEDA